MAGIYHNAELGVISMSSDGENWLTIADKNLGATQVYNNGDTLSEANSGKLYQWGNNYGFPFDGPSSVTSSTINGSNYGPGNYYNSSVFYFLDGVWDSSDNTNLWGGDTGTNSAMRGPCPEGFHIPSKTDFQNLISIGGNIGAWTTSSGYATSSEFTEMLFFPLTGFRRNSNTGIYNRGTIGYYWMSTYRENKNAWVAQITSTGGGVGGSNMTGNGLSIRAFSNDGIKPDYTWTKLYGDDLPRPKIIKRFQNSGNYYYFKNAPIHITSIALNETSLTLDTVGDTYQLTATVDNPDAVDTHIYWSSSDSSIAVVSKTGFVTCIKPGDCTITASCDGITANCSISYTKVTGVTLNKSSIGLANVGDTFQLVATITPSTAVYKTVTWTSNDTSIATVDDTGLVTCVSVGECTITCTTDDGGYIANCSVKENATLYFDYILVGGGGGGILYAGGGGGAVCLGQHILTESESLNITIGCGGRGHYYNPDYTGSNTEGTDGGDSYIVYNGGDCSIIAQGGKHSCCCQRGGMSGSGKIGGYCCSYYGYSGGGGGGALCNGCNAGSELNGGSGGAGICGYGGGGGGQGDSYRGTGVDGGGDGGTVNYKTGCNATNCGGGGGGHGNDIRTPGGCGACGLVEICYPTDGTYGFTCAAGGNICCTVTVDDITYCVHRFTSDGTFTITG